MCLHTCPIFAQITQPILTTQSFSHDNAIETVSLNAKQENSAVIQISLWFTAHSLRPCNYGANASEHHRRSQNFQFLYECSCWRESEQLSIKNAGIRMEVRILAFLLCKNINGKLTPGPESPNINYPSGEISKTGAIWEGVSFLRPPPYPLTRFAQGSCRLRPPSWASCRCWAGRWRWFRQ